MTKKKKKAPAAQQLIESLLNEKSPYRDSLKGSKSSSSPIPVPAQQDETTNSESIELNLDALEMPEDVVIENVRELAADQSKESRVASRSEHSGTFSVDLEAGDEASVLSLEGPSAEPVLDPVAQAEKTAMIERTRMQAIKKDQKDEEEIVEAGEALEDFSAAHSNTYLSDEPEPFAAFESATEPTASEAAEDASEHTVRIQPVKMSGGAAAAQMRHGSTAIDRATVTEIRPGARAANRGGGAPSSAVFTSAEATLKQSESLRIAQARISELEKELERLRRENEKLSTAGETLKRRADELAAKSESIESHARETQRIFEEEKRVMRGQLTQKDRENSDLRMRNEEMEARLESNFKKIRVRERELEHRLEIVKMESATLVATKDKMILELKRQIDQLTHETEYGKQRSQELFNQYKDKQETVRRVVRALRIALTILEGDEDNVSPLKKAE